MDWPQPPDGLFLAWYADDFTGSAATLEVLSFAGFASAMFLEPPGPADLARFPGLCAMGIAGDARTRSPEWMDRNLPSVFAALRATGARIVHHKVCSTMDSAPHIGSIGKAAEIGLADGGWAPLVLAAPGIGRWQAFGTLFARSAEGVVRLDRHPTMARHPVTPMTEADVRRHIGAQTPLPVGLVTLLDLKSGRGEEAVLAERARGARIIAFDVIDDETLAETGRLIWAAALQEPTFVIGSQGIEYALAAAFARGGQVAPEAARAGPVARTVVVSGSCSPDTARQIAVAEAGGFVTVAVDAACAGDGAAWDQACARAGQAALAALGEGRSVILHTALGPDDPRVSAVEALPAARREATHRWIGEGLGDLLARLTSSASLTRVGIAGGDTSSAATRALGLLALTAGAQLAPGAPLLVGHPCDPASPTLEVLLKGGQMGGPDIFLRLRDGT